MWISIKNPDRVIWLARNYKWACHLNLFRTTRVKGLDTAGRFSAICYKEGIFFFFFYFLFTIMHIKFFVCFFLLFCFVLRFYGPVNPMGSYLAWSVYLNTLLLDRFIPLIGNPVLCTFLRQKLTTALLESAEGREWPKKIVHDQSPRKKVPTWSGSNQQSPVHQLDAHPTQSSRLACTHSSFWKGSTLKGKSLLLMEAHPFLLK